MANPDNFINFNRLKDLISQLVNIYSPSGKEEDILRYLKNYLEAYNLPVKVQRVDTTRYNILVSEKPADVMFIGHVDTVPAFNLEDYRFGEENGRLSGLGCVDMKSGVAAMVESFVSVWENFGELPAGLALVVGEEETSDGAQALVKENKFDWAVIGEPTDLVPCLSHYGYLEMELNTYGYRRHASFADIEHNATYNMLNVLLKLTEYLNENRASCIYNIRDLHSSESGFSVPDKCTCWLDVHVRPDMSVDNIAGELKERALAFISDEGSPEKFFSLSTIHYGYQLTEKDEFIDLLKGVYKRNGFRWSSGSFRSDSDANLLWAAGVKPVILGPGKLAKAHTNDENIGLSEIIACSDLYYKILREILSDGS